MLFLRADKRNVMMKISLTHWCDDSSQIPPISSRLSPSSQPQFLTVICHPASSCSMLVAGTYAVWEMLVLGRRAAAHSQPAHGSWYTVQSAFAALLLAGALSARRLISCRRRPCMH
jgi:hypothetical protein